MTTRIRRLLWKQNCRRSRDRRRPFDRDCTGIQSLEERILMDAAPYIIEASSTGTLSAYAFDFGLDKGEMPRVLYDETQPHSVSATITPNVVPGVPYTEEVYFERLLAPGDPSDDASSSAYVHGFFYHTDNKRSIGQPETASVYLEAEVFASAAVS